MSERVLERIRSRAAPEYRAAFSLAAGKIHLDLSGVPAEDQAALRLLVAEDSLGEEQAVEIEPRDGMSLEELHRALVADGQPLRGLLQEGDALFAILDGSASQALVDALAERARTVSAASPGLAEAKAELVAVEAERGEVEAAAAVAPPGTFAQELAALDERRADALAKILAAQQAL